MRDIASKIVEFLDSKGIDSVVFLTVMGIVFVVSTVRSLRAWEKLLYYEKWMVAMELTGSIAMTLAGFVLLLKRLL